MFGVKNQNPCRMLKTLGYEIDFVDGFFGQNELFSAADKNEP
jgi:hypothetical protein